MHINPYGEGPVLLAADLANDPPSDLNGLVRRCTDHDLLIDTAGPTDVEMCHELIRAWLTVVDAPTETVRVARLNALLEVHSSRPRVVNHTKSGWHIHYREPASTLTDQLAALILVGTALHLTERGIHRLGRCASSDCDRVFADVSRNGTQRYCSPRCGSREAVRRHRAR